MATITTELQTESDSLLTRKEAAKILRCGPSFIYQLRKAGKIQAIKAGKKVLFKKSAISEYVNKNMEGSQNV